MPASGGLGIKATRCFRMGGVVPARLPCPGIPAQSAGMKMLAKPSAKKSVRRAAVRKSVKKTAPRQTRAEFVAEVKAICARIDAGRERMYSSEEVKRELGL